jgi:hypothetical protein
MNERIKLLAKQAGFGLRRDGEIYTSRLEHLPITEDLKKFAELIMRECIETIAENMYSGITPSDFSDGADFAYAQAISDIKEHFGVEE